MSAFHEDKRMKIFVLFKSNEYFIFEIFAHKSIVRNAEYGF